MGHLGRINLPSPGFAANIFDQVWQGWAEEKFRERIQVPEKIKKKTEVAQLKGIHIEQNKKIQTKEQWRSNW